MKTTFEHKYNIGDTVYILDGDAAHKEIYKVKVVAIECTIKLLKGNIIREIKYALKGDTKYTIYSECSVFPTKRELINAYKVYL